MPYITLLSSLPARRVRVVCLSLAVALVAAACGAPGPAAVRIVHFNDIGEIGPLEGGRTGGLARVASVVRELESDEVPVLVTLGGDFLSPSAIGTARLDGEPLAGRQTVAVLNALGLDVATFGNHEFDLSEPLLRQRLRETAFAMVSSNVTDAAGQPFDEVEPHAVLSVESGGRTLRLGVVAVTIAFNLKPYVRYVPPIEAVREQVRTLERRTDAIVALTHQDLVADVELANAVPEIDLVLGGHDHENWNIRRGQHFTPIIKADANTRSVAIVTLTFGEPGAEPDVEAGHRVLDTAVPVDPVVDAEVGRWMDIGLQAFRDSGFEPDAVVATLTEPLDGRERTVRNVPSSLADVITAAMAKEVGGADAVVLNGGSIRIDDVALPGPVTEYDVIRMLPFGGSVLKASVEGALLARILDAGEENRGVGGYLQTRGVSRADSRWNVQGEPIAPNRRYVVALPEFLLTGGETRLGFLTREHPQVHEVEAFRDVRRALIDELRRRYGR